MENTRRAVITGVVIAVVAVLVLGGAALWWMRSRGPMAQDARPEKVVVVFAGPGEDGADVAMVIALRSSATGAWEYIDPDKSVTVAGTSYDRLADAYPFGGAAAVAEALGLGTQDGWVDVTLPAWQAVLGAGIELKIPKDMNMFDGKRFVRVKEGTATVPPGDVSMVLNGTSYLSDEERAQLMYAASSGSMRALVAAAAALPAGVESNMSPEAVAEILSAGTAP